MGDGERRYSVTGMTCQHCVAAVSEHVGALAGVSAVDVDLDSGVVVVSGSEIDDAAVRDVVTSAGYSLA